MGLAHSLVEARRNMLDSLRVIRVLNPKADISAFDPEKYHRAFVAGLIGLPAGLISFVALYTAGRTLEAVASLAVSFLTPFTIQLGVEYNIKKDEMEREAG